MKKTVLTAVAILVSAAAQAGIVEQTKSKPELAGTLEVASLAEWTSKVSMLGQTISNPIVPMLALSSGQQAVEKAYGKLRADSPVWMGCYVYMPAFHWTKHVTGPRARK